MWGPSASLLSPEQKKARFGWRSKEARNERARGMCLGVSLLPTIEMPLPPGSNVHPSVLIPATTHSRLPPPSLFIPADFRSYPTSGSAHLPSSCHPKYSIPCHDSKRLELVKVLDCPAPMPMPMPQSPGPLYPCFPSPSPSQSQSRFVHPLPSGIMFPVIPTEACLASPVAGSSGPRDLCMYLYEISLLNYTHKALTIHALPSCTSTNTRHAQTCFGLQQSIRIRYSQPPTSLTQLTV